MDNINNSHILKKDYKDALKELKNNNVKFDLVFLDPPYKLNIINDSIKKILEYDLLNKNGLIICEYEEELVECDLELIKEKKYGTTYVKIYKNF